MKNRTLYGQLIVSLFLATFLAQTFSHFFIIADYYTHIAEYAKNCENKAFPMMHCNGKCQLMKKLRQEQKEDQDNQERLANGKNEVVFFSRSGLACLTAPVLDLHSVATSEFRYYGPSLILCVDIFHPPRA
ncbi:MAG TPA: hypothetical protein VG052_05670 [Puia sp.]|nr:hypothetical protein [Puia sp.]